MVNLMKVKMNIPKILNFQTFNEEASVVINNQFSQVSTTSVWSTSWYCVKWIQLNMSAIIQIEAGWESEEEIDSHLWNISAITQEFHFTTLFTHTAL